MEISNGHSDGTQGGDVYFLGGREKRKSFPSMIAARKRKATARDHFRVRERRLRSGRKFIRPPGRGGGGRLTNSSVPLETRKKGRRNASISKTQEEKILVQSCIASRKMGRKGKREKSLSSNCIRANLWKKREAERQARCMPRPHSAEDREKTGKGFV